MGILEGYGGETRMGILEGYGGETSMGILEGYGKRMEGENCNGRGENGMVGVNIQPDSQILCFHNILHVCFSK